MVDAGQVGEDPVHMTAEGRSLCGVGGFVWRSFGQHGSGPSAGILCRGVRWMVRGLLCMHAHGVAQRPQGSAPAAPAPPGRPPPRFALPPLEPVPATVAGAQAAMVWRGMSHRTRCRSPEAKARGAAGAGRQWCLRPTCAATARMRQRLGAPPAHLLRSWLACSAPTLWNRCVPLRRCEGPQPRRS